MLLNVRHQLRAKLWRVEEDIGENRYGGFVQRCGRDQPVENAAFKSAPFAPAMAVVRIG
jgi:hypothetical protein